MYTQEFIIEQIMKADLALSDVTTESELDTSQSRQKEKRSPTAARRARETWLGMLYTCYPAAYKENFGSNAVLITTPEC